MQGSPRTHTPDILTVPVLLLNAYFAPVSLTTARRGIVLLYGGAAKALDESGETHDFRHWRALPVRDAVDDAIPILGGALRVPRVLHLQRYERVPKAVVRLTRRNVMLRDEHTCQYCTRRLPVRELNLDHVVPRCRGGPDSWENLVTSCRSCNLRKGRRTPDEAGMHLLKRPHKPRWSTTAQILLTEKRPYSEWEPYLAAG